VSAGEPIPVNAMGQPWSSRELLSAVIDTWAKADGIDIDPDIAADAVAAEAAFRRYLFAAHDTMRAASLARDADGSAPPPLSESPGFDSRRGYP
jgi:hypothetical protein